MKTAICVVLALGIATVALAADVPVKVYVNGKLQSFTPPAVLRGGAVYVPLRAGAQSLGLSVKWHAENETAQVCTDKGCAMIRKSQGIMSGQSLLLPLRKMGEVTGAKLSWDAGRKAVFVTK